MAKQKRFWLAGVMVLVASAALAQTVVVPPPVPESSTSVAIPIALWAEAARDTVLGIAVALAAYAMRALPENIVNILRTMRADQLLTKGIDYALNRVVGAAQNKPILNVNVGNEAVALAVQYVIDNGPTFLINWMGGAEGIRSKVIARLPTAPEVSLSP